MGSYYDKKRMEDDQRKVEEIVTYLRKQCGVTVVNERMLTEAMASANLALEVRSWPVVGGTINA